MNLLEFTSTIHYYVYSHCKPRLSTSQTLIAIEHRYRKNHISYIRLFLERDLNNAYKDL